MGDHGCEYMTGGRVVVLGQTGRNFAAGMSGGVAWVLDLKDSASTRSSSSSAPVSDEAAEELESLVRAHFEETGSTVAEELLEDWETALTRFTEVMPRDYRIVHGRQGQGRGRRPGRERGRHAMMEALHG